MFAERLGFRAQLPRGGGRTAKESGDGAFRCDEAAPQGRAGAGRPDHVLNARILLLTILLARLLAGQNKGADLRR